MVKHQWYTTPLANAVREIMNQHDYLFVIPGRNIAHIARKDDGKISSACGVSNTYKFSEVYVIDTPNRVSLYALIASCASDDFVTIQKP